MAKTTRITANDVLKAVMATPEATRKATRKDLACVAKSTGEAIATHEASSQKRHDEIKVALTTVAKSTGEAIATHEASSQQRQNEIKVALTTVAKSTGEAIASHEAASQQRHNDHEAASLQRYNDHEAASQRRHNETTSYLSRMFCAMRGVNLSPIHYVIAGVFGIVTAFVVLYLLSQAGHDVTSIIRDADGNAIGSNTYTVGQLAVPIQRLIAALCGIIAFFIYCAFAILLWRPHEDTNDDTEEV